MYLSTMAKWLNPCVTSMTITTSKKEGTVVTVGQVAFSESQSFILRCSKPDRYQLRSLSMNCSASGRGMLPVKNLGHLTQSWA